MSLNLHPQGPQTRGPQVPAPTIAPDTATEIDLGNTVVERAVLVHHGIHSGHFPIAGLTVGDARQTLRGLLNIDPEAVAVINGEVVDEEDVIAPNTTMLSFVKPSAVKG